MSDQKRKSTGEFLPNFLELFNDKSRLILLAVSFAVIVASILIRPITIEGWDTTSFFLSYVLPFVIYFIFLLMAAFAIGELRNESRNEEEITRIVDKYEGVVDGIGTALPLVGAGLILYFISQIQPGHKSSSELDPNQVRFLHIGAPFEVKSIFILAAAKLFEPIFDSLARASQTGVSVGGAGDADYSVLNQILSDEDLEAKLSMIKDTSMDLRSTIQTLGSDNVKQSLDQLVELSKKLK